MTNVGQNPFQAEQQLSDTISQGFQKQADDYKQANRDNIVADKKKHIIEETLSTEKQHSDDAKIKKSAVVGDPTITYFAEESQKGHETHVSMIGMPPAEPFS